MTTQDSANRCHKSVSRKYSTDLSKALAGGPTWPPRERQSSLLPRLLSLSALVSFFLLAAISRAFLNLFTNLHFFTGSGMAQSKKYEDEQFVWTPAVSTYFKHYSFGTPPNFTLHSTRVIHRSKITTKARSFLTRMKNHDQLASLPRPKATTS